MSDVSWVTTLSHAFCCTETCQSESKPLRPVCSRKRRPLRSRFKAPIEELFALENTSILSCCVCLQEIFAFIYWPVFQLTGLVTCWRAMLQNVACWDGKLIITCIAMWGFFFLLFIYLNECCFNECSIKIQMLLPALSEASSAFLLFSKCHYLLLCHLFEKSLDLDRFGNVAHARFGSYRCVWVLCHGWVVVMVGVCVVV